MPATIATTAIRYVSCRLLVWSSCLSLAFVYTVYFSRMIASSSFGSFQIHVISDSWRSCVEQDASPRRGCGGEAYAVPTQVRILFSFAVCQDWLVAGLAVGFQHTSQGNPEIFVFEVWDHLLFRCFCRCRFLGASSYQGLWQACCHCQTLRMQYGKITSGKMIQFGKILRRRSCRHSIRQQVGWER